MVFFNLFTIKQKAFIANIYLIYMATTPKKKFSIVREIKDDFGKIKELNDMLRADEVLERIVTEFGTGAHIIVPRKHIGKKARIIIRENK